MDNDGVDGMTTQVRTVELAALERRETKASPEA